MLKLSFVLEFVANQFYFKTDVVESNQNELNRYLVKNLDYKIYSAVI